MENNPNLATNLVGRRARLDDGEECEIVAVCILRGALQIYVATKSSIRWVSDKEGLTIIK